MAKKSKIISCNIKKQNYLDSLQRGKKPFKQTQVYNRCEICGRPHGYMGLFRMCRICFRYYATRGLIPGVTKSSW